MQTRRWIFGVTILTGVALFAWWKINHPPLRQSLLARATKIVPPAGFYGNYDWISNHEVILATNATNGLFFTRFDLNEKRESPGGGFPRFLGGRFMRAPFKPSVSPDGRWILFVDVQATGPAWTAERVDGSRRSTWPVQGTMGKQMLRLEAEWTPDSRHWLELTDGLNGIAPIFVHDLNAPNWQASFKPLPGSISLLGGTADGKAIVSIPTQDKSDTQDLLAIPRGANSVLHNTSIRLPERAKIEEIRLSPRGDRLAWKLRYTPYSYHQSTIEEIKWNIGMVPISRVALVVSYLDGSRMKEVGYLETPTNLIGIWNLRWSPDGRRISFWNERSLYIVPAE